MDDIFFKNLFYYGEDDHPSKEALYKTFYHQMKIHESLKHRYEKKAPEPHSYNEESLEISNIILSNLIDEIEYYPTANLSKAKNLKDIILNCITPGLVYEICDREKRNTIGLLVIEDKTRVRVYYSKHYISYRESSEGKNIDKSDRIQLKEYIIKLFNKL